MKRKFTLIEILAVTLLISVLAGIGIAAYTYAMESSRESATKALILRLSAALNDLRDKGLLTKTDVGSGTEFTALVFNPDPLTAKDTGDKDSLRFAKAGSGTTTKAVGSNTANQIAAYKAFAKAVVADNIKRNVNSDNQIIDAWGNPIYIRFPGKLNRGGFDIISAGSDGFFAAGAKEITDINTNISDLDKHSCSGNDCSQNGDYFLRDCKTGEWICDDLTNL